MATPEERKKLAAEEYLSANRVRWLFENVTADLTRFTPTDPHAFIARRIREIQDQARLTVHRNTVIAVIGGPASGVGVACAHLANELGTCTVAPSELLRNEIKDGTDTGRKVGELMHAGQPVPTDVIAQLITQKLAAFRGDPEDAPVYALDGFPRTLEQALHVEQHVAEISKVVYLKVKDETMRARMEGRAATAAQDDDVEPHRSERIEYFTFRTLPVIEYYRAQGKVVEIDAELPIRDVMTLVERAARK